MISGLALSTIYRAIKAQKDISAFADFCHVDNATLKSRLCNPEFQEFMAAMFQSFCVQKYLAGKKKAKPRGAWVANRGRSGEIKRLSGMFASERQFWEAGNGD